MSLKSMGTETFFFSENWSLFPKSSIPETVSFKERKTSGNTIPFQIFI